MKPDQKLRNAFILGSFAALLLMAAGLAFWSSEKAPEPVIVAATAPAQPEPVFTEMPDRYAPKHKEQFGPEYIPVHNDILDFSSAKAIIEKMGPFQPVTKPEPEKKTEPAKPKIGKVDVKKPSGQYWKKNAAPAGATSGKAKIVIIIDDMGMGRKHSYDVINLEPPLTLAFLPYAPKLDEITKAAKARGHELLIHMPMEPMDRLNPGPIALFEKMNESELNAMLDKAFNSFSGYVGINNHMGSRLTQNESAMHVVMNALAERGLIFVDSKTIGHSVAERIAAEHGLDHAGRDVFLDHEDNINFVRKALLELEGIARRNGSAIAIGHPKAATIQGLKEWLPLAEQRGFVVVPVSAVVKRQAPKIEATKIVFGPEQPKAFPTLQPYPLQSPQP